MTSVSSKGPKPHRKGHKTTFIKVNSTSETVDAQYELEKRRLSKKRELRTVQYDKYSKTFYGSPTEKESLKREHRQALLDQVKHKELASKEAFSTKVQESQAAAALDKTYTETDNKKNGSRTEYLKQFRDENKQLMESRANEKLRKRDEENRKERELLQNDPINWTKTLV